jgi:hypothetical protein
MSFILLFIVRRKQKLSKPWRKLPGFVVEARRFEGLPIPAPHRLERERKQQPEGSTEQKAHNRLFSLAEMPLAALPPKWHIVSVKQTVTSFSNVAKAGRPRQIISLNLFRGRKHSAQTSARYRTFGKNRESIR